jgi:hypothetical protein
LVLLGPSSKTVNTINPIVTEKTFPAFARIGRVHIQEVRNLGGNGVVTTQHRQLPRGPALSDRNAESRSQQHAKHISRNVREVEAVDSWAAQRAAEGLSVQSVNTCAYCKARQRLPVEMVSTLTRYTAQQLSARAQAGWRWRGRSVKLADGTGILMPDTAANQACYPQLSSQAIGVGSPLARLVE